MYKGVNKLIQGLHYFLLQLNLRKSADCELGGGEPVSSSPWHQESPSGGASGGVAFASPATRQTRVLSAEKQRQLGLPEGFDLRNTDV